MTTLNRDLLLKTADYIENHPDEYDQGEWCGTTRCVAGTAVFLVVGNENINIDSQTALVDGTWMLVGDAATKLLGFSDLDMVEYLFSPSWLPPDVPAALRDIAEAKSDEAMMELITAGHHYYDDEWDD